MQKQHTHPLSWAGMLVTLGIVFGDIGTSPLYVFKAVVGETNAISEQLVLGALSCIFWTLTLQTTFKYILITLRADNRGEGGVFSLYTLVRRFGKWAWLPAIIGAATLLADGILTPPISVASAIEGLAGVEAFAGIIGPGNTTTILVVVAIISLLFFFQRFGTKVVGLAFGPIMLVWFSMLLVLGLLQVVHAPHVLRASIPCTRWTC
jgi:KUP system potassium uptake protein